MFQDILFTFLISFSPFGEARAGIPYGELVGLPILWVFVIGLTANLLVFPVFYKVIELANKNLWKNPLYKRTAIYLSSRARTKTKTIIKKYGVWGLMVFVMIPLPVTGAYIGTIASYIFGISYRKSLIAISSGITISSIMVTAFMYAI
ncbi:small multi-drug export protein [Flavobacteriales bacterium]|jgi:uncharacterized membrane protein|nr:small multi-drug export protein [Flavobacteriales bacterium]MDB4250724.1 small multi-drug export protein [Flavobacteriales bacterium]|tara:strand:- start:646 stop:1089 length:444 start_codon:yes stop_codon:yes gene_type:complete